MEKQLEYLEDRVTLHTSEDAFRAFVLSQAQQAGVTQVLLQRIDATILAELARAESAQQEERLLAAKERAQRAGTVRQILSEPVALAVVGVLSTLMTGMISLLLHLAGAS